MWAEKSLIGCFQLNTTNSRARFAPASPNDTRHKFLRCTVGHPAYAALVRTSDACKFPRILVSIAATNVVTRKHRTSARRTGKELQIMRIVSDSWLLLRYSTPTYFAGSWGNFKLDPLDLSERIHRLTWKRGTVCRECRFADWGITFRHLRNRPIGFRGLPH